MKIRTLTVGLAFFAFCLHSCAPMTETVYIQAVQPSEESDALINKKIAIIGNLYYANPELGQQGGYVYDSTLLASATQGLKETLEQSPMLEDADISIYYSYVSDTAKIGKPIPKNEIDSIANDVGADIIINVDYVSCNEQYKNESKVASSVYCYSYSSLFRTYDAETGKRILQVQIKSEDSEFITFKDDNGYPLAIAPETGKELFIKRIGNDYALKLAPHWEEELRACYVGPDSENRYLERAAKYVRSGEWEQAMKLWESALSSLNPKTVAMAAYNLALGCEMMGEFELAKEWLTYCGKQQQSKVDPSAYLAIIEERIGEKEVLDKLISK